ncbi:MAG: polysaccharide pyruvyl transferase CsaB [Cyclobacteriaceae bacterium]|nr:MAG: polysaccharide pyruvyl transferase CsaB [Cyclobacteriaceae bacterium]
MRILLQGYYGFGNLGDDVLLRVTLGIMRQIFPQAHYTLFVNAPAERAAYLQTYLGEKLDYINYSARAHFDLIVHGGGGVHYDYAPGSFWHYLLNRFISIQPQAFTGLYHAYKKLKGKEHITAAHRVGLGIGLGTFTSSSSKWYTNVPVLTGYEYLMVRDSHSKMRASSLCPKAQVVLGTDLAFYTDYWRPLVAPPSGSNATRVGFVLRDWPHPDYLMQCIRVAGKLAAMGLQISFFSFEQLYDKTYIRMLNGKFPCTTWPQDEKSFFAQFAAQDVIVTSRFHGAILASIFHIPSVTIAIEPKLSTLRELLPQSCRLISVSEAETKGINEITTMLKEPETWRANAVSDALRNRNQIENSILDFKNFVKGFSWNGLTE